MMLDVAYWITQALLAAAILCTVYRIYRGPSILDRVISLDVILIIVGSIMLADMAYRQHQDFILFVVVTAVIGFLGAVAIARYVAVRTPDTESPSDGQTEQPAVEPEPPTSSPDEADESTSWFAALTSSGFRPQRHDQQESAARGSTPQDETGSSNSREGNQR